MPAPATFYVVRGGADVRWRAEMPAAHVGARLNVIPDKQANRVFTKPHRTSKYFAWSPTEEGAEYPNHEGAAVWTRPDLVRATHAAAMSANGIRTVAEVDDNYLSAADQNIFMRMSGYDEKGRRAHLEALASMDAIILSTRKLRDIYHKTMKKELRHAPEMFVARNHVDPESYENREDLLPPATRLRVGWAGSHQHVWDLRLAAPSLRLAYDLGCEVVLIGLNPADHDPAWTEFLPEYTHVGWLSPEEYHTKRINIDIGLCPLVQNFHTDGKSDIKMLEYGMSGAAVVAQSSPVYNKTMVHGETGLLASGPDDMGEKMLHLIRHPNFRQKLVDNLKQYILEERTIQKQGVPEWMAAIDGTS